MRLAVVGHVEWVDFVPVPALPRPGSVVHAEGAFTAAGGGGGVAAAVLASRAEVDFFCALGRDSTGEQAARQLTARGVSLQVAWRGTATRRAITLLEEDGERTIITVGDRLEPSGDDPLEWERLEHADGVYLTAGDAAAGRRARRSPVLVATPRARWALEDPGVRLDALVYSASDEVERAWAERLADRARLLVATEGEAGGRWWGESQGRWRAAPPSGPPRDAYGCGDSFAAGFTLGLAAGQGPARAAEIGARLGADALAVRGAP
jgi:ribokinase